EALWRVHRGGGAVRATSARREHQTIQARASLATVDDRVGGRRTIVQSPYRFSNATSGGRGRAPYRGEHNGDVLRDWLGMKDADIATLAEQGILKVDDPREAASPSLTR